jgi:ABC-type multidrug transport system permease subunit
MVKLVDRYIGRAALIGVLAVWFTMTILFILLSLLGELRDITGDYGRWSAWAVLLPPMSSWRSGLPVFPAHGWRLQALPEPCC